MTEITASVDVLAFDPTKHDDTDKHKIRVVIWTGPDFHTPTINSSAVCDTRQAAEISANRARDACALLNIPLR